MSTPAGTLQTTEVLVTLYHSDMAAARAFYEDKLGLEIREVTYDWYVGYWLNPSHSTTLCVSSSPSEREQWGAEGRGVVVDFMVADVDETYRQLRERGVDFEHPPKDFPWGLRHARFRDPEGYVLNISSYASKSPPSHEEGDED